MAHILQYLTPGEDFPAELANNPDFPREVEKTTRRRLELRPQDTVTVIISGAEDATRIQ